MNRETIGFIMYRELPDDDKPYMETHGLHFMPVTDTGESDESHTRATPWSRQEAKMSASIGLRPVLVVRADVDRIGTKINIPTTTAILSKAFPTRRRQMSRGW